MDKQTAIGKIRKCLALAKSSEPHEAAAAMRQAQKLIEQFGIEHPEPLVAGVSEEWSKSAAASRPVRYEVALVSTVADAYGCELVFTRRLNRAHSDIEGGYSFIGIDPGPEVASYTFDVLARQLRAPRRDYIRSKLRRCGPKNKTARADEFCEGWVRAVRQSIQPAQRSGAQDALVDAYMRANCAATSSLSPTRREVGGRRDSFGDRMSGYASGKRANVSKGLGTAPEIARLGHA